MPEPSSTSYTTPTAAGSTRWKPWLWRPMNQRIALKNARGASIELFRRRIEREAVDVFIAQLGKDANRPRRGHRP